VDRLTAVTFLAAMFKGPSRPAVLVSLFCSAYLAYQIPLPLWTTGRYPDFWFFGLDNYRIAMERPGTHEAANYQITKHPGFVAMAIPLHRVGKAIFRGLPEPKRENAALTFPSAVFGSANDCIA
jgi:hypothetical protein